LTLLFQRPDLAGRRSVRAWLLPFRAREFASVRNLMLLLF